MSDILPQDFPQSRQRNVIMIPVKWTPAAIPSYSAGLNYLEALVCWLS